MLGRVVDLSLNARNQPLDSGQAQRINRMMNRGQRRIKHSSEHDVVNADDRDISRNRQTEFSHCGANS
jgi:hypothetical protein